MSYPRHIQPLIVEDDSGVKELYDQLLEDLGNL